MRSRSPGFTLIEVMIVVAIVGILAATAIANYSRFQLRSKTAEAKMNLQGIRTAEESYLAEFGSYVKASASPASYGGTRAVAFVDAGSTGSNFDAIGWRPEGLVYFQYSVSVAGGAYTAEAAADIDGNMTPQVWGFVRPDVVGNTATSVLGCSGVWNHVTSMADLTQTVGPCGPLYGQGEF